MGRRLQPSEDAGSQGQHSEDAGTDGNWTFLDGALDRVSIAIVDGTSVTYAHFGADSATEYEIGSVTKTFTSLLLADVIARGDIAADTTVRDAAEWIRAMLEASSPGASGGGRGEGRL